MSWPGRRVGSAHHASGRGALRFARRLGRFIFFFAGGIVMAWAIARDESRDETLAERERRLRRAL